MNLVLKCLTTPVVGDANGSVLSGTHITIAQVTSRSLSTVDQEIAIQVIRQKDDTMAIR